MLLIFFFSFKTILCPSFIKYFVIGLLGVENNMWEILKLTHYNVIFLINKFQEILSMFYIN